MKLLLKWLHLTKEALKAKLRSLLLKSPKFQRCLADYQFRRRAEKFHGRWAWILRGGMVRL